MSENIEVDTVLPGIVTFYLGGVAHVSAPIVSQSGKSLLVDVSTEPGVNVLLGLKSVHVGVEVPLVPLELTWFTEQQEVETPGLKNKVVPEELDKQSAWPLVIWHGEAPSFAIEIHDNRRHVRFSMENERGFRLQRECDNLDAPLVISQRDSWFLWRREMSQKALSKLHG